MKICKPSLGLILVLATSASLADITLPRLLGDGAVLQRDTPVVLWGFADEGERISVYLDEQPIGVTAARDGRWRVSIDAQPAGGPHRLRFEGNNTAAIDDVWFGDVWVASGQSNMELPMERVAPVFGDAIAAANFPRIRQFKVPRKYDFASPREDFEDGSWVAADPDAVLQFSAVGFFFARALHESYEVPIGIVSSNFGGSAAESWMSEEALAEYPHYLEIAKSYREDGYLASLIASDRAVVQQWNDNVDARDPGLEATVPWFDPAFDDADWPQFQVPGFWAATDVGAANGAFWFRKSVDLPAELAGKPARLLLGTIVDADVAWVNGVKVGNTTYQYPPRRYAVPEGVLRAGRNTIAVRVVNSAGAGGFTLDKAYVLEIDGHSVDLAGSWHWKVAVVTEPIEPPRFVEHRQPLGFSNAMLAPLLPMRIKGVIWYQGETNVGRAEEYRTLFPDMIRDWRHRWGQGDFPFLFVQLANFLPAHSEPTESSWAELRAAQAAALALPATAMAVAIDVGEWNDIHPLDKKTVGERLAQAARRLAYGESDLVAAGPTLLGVTRCDDGLEVRFDNADGGLVVDGEVPIGFAVAGRDGRYVWADARIEGDVVRLHSPEIAQPVHVRYAWADNPEGANLYNEAGFPAAPFQASVD